VIYDLLLKNSGPLELREDPDQGVCVAGLKRIQVCGVGQGRAAVVVTVIAGLG
jgi:hypothetical protein